MKNLWLILVPLLLFLLGFVIAIIIIFIKKPKQYLFINLTLIVLVCVCSFYLLPPYFKDLIKQDINTFEGEYIYSVTTGVMPGTKYLNFENNHKEDYLIVPRITKEFNLIEGEIYKISYYVNTHVVYSVELIQ